MKVFTLKRMLPETDCGIFGVLWGEKYPICVALERPWLNNKPNESCIPKGEYICRRVNSPHFGNTFEVQGVAGRSDILFHKGNTMADSKGCIILATGFAWINGTKGVMMSGAGYTEFMADLAAENEFKLVITEA